MVVFTVYRGSCCCNRTCGRVVVADNVDHCKMTNQWPGTVPGAVILIYRDGTHWRRERKGEAEGRRREDLGGCTAKVREKGRGREMEITEEGSGGEGIPFFRPTKINIPLISYNISWKVWQREPVYNINAHLSMHLETLLG